MAPARPSLPGTTARPGPAAPPRPPRPRPAVDRPTPERPPAARRPGRPAGLRGPLQCLASRVVPRAVFPGVHRQGMSLTQPVGHARQAGPLRSGCHSRTRQILRNHRLGSPGLPDLRTLALAAHRGFLALSVSGRLALLYCQDSRADLFLALRPWLCLGPRARCRISMVADRPRTGLRLGSGASCGAKFPATPRARIDCRSERLAELGNDIAGGCNAVTWANRPSLVTATLATEHYPSQEQVWEFYRRRTRLRPERSARHERAGHQCRSGHGRPGRTRVPARDGGPDGVKAVAFAKVDQRISRR